MVCSTPCIRAPCSSRRNARQLFRSVFLVVCCGAALVFSSPGGAGASVSHIAAMPQGTPVRVFADRISYDGRNEIATATGRVRLTYGSYELEARKLVYDKRNDTMKASGEVAFRDSDGNRLTAENAVLKNRFREGFARHLKLLLANDATLTAQYARRRDGHVTIYEHVTYTACKICHNAGKEPPTWQVRARKATHDENTHRITYEDATFKMFGIPIFYLPFFRNADPFVKRQSGFLKPKPIVSTDYGLGLEIPYFWALSPYYDFTFRPTIITSQGPLLRGEWRHRMKNGHYMLDIGGLYQTDTDQPSPGDRRLRGFVHSIGNFNISRKWSWGWDITEVSDDTFMRRYKIDPSDQLTNEIHLSGIDDRNSLSAFIYNFRGLRGEDRLSFDPYIVPSIRHNMTLDHAVLGGEMSIDTNFYSLHRRRPVPFYRSANQGTDTTRIVGTLGWQRRIVTAMGQVVTPFADLRGDLYHYTQNGDEKLTGHLTPDIGVSLNWPFIRQDRFGRHIVSPKAQLIAAPDGGDHDDLPNEDSIALDFTDANLFSHNRFSGLDRHEQGTRAMLGFTYALVTPNGGFAKLDLGESFHLSGHNNFAQGSGLEGNRSDIVTALTLQPSDDCAMIYKARLDDATLDFKAQDIGLIASFSRFDAGIDYVDIDKAVAYGHNEADKQVAGQISLDLSPKWTVFGGLRYDIRGRSWIDNSIGIDYNGDCVSVRLAYLSDFTRDRDVKPGHSIAITIGFRSLGGVSFSVDPDWIEKRQLLH